MASIKERAAALNLAEKLRSRPLVHGFAVKPVQCLQLASSLISHLRSSLKVKRRRIYLKSHNDCFLGTEAVDVVVEHITNDKAFEGATASRDKVVNVCQALLDCNVFDVVGTKVFGKDKKRAEFQDSKSALYKFVNENVPTVEDLEKGVLLKSIQELFSSFTSDRNAQQTYSSGPQCLMPTPVKFTQMSTQVPHLDSTVCSSLPLQTSMDNLNISPNRGQTHTVLPQSLVDEVWQEQTILRLLNLVELPLLEGVLQCSQISSCSAPFQSLTPNNPDLISSSSHLDRQILRAFKHSQADEWLCAALDCLDFLPDQPVVQLSREMPFLFPQEQQCTEQVKADGNIPAQSKLLLYGALVRHYSNTDRPPLLPEQMTDVYTAITELIVNAKLGRALEALQLCLKLLPPNCREELRRLLHFMTVAGDAQGIMLEKEQENRLVVKTSFSRAILNSKALSKEREDLMLVFMLSNIKEIFKIPGTLHKEVSAKLAGLAHREEPNDTGCLVSSRTYTDCTNNTTNQELWTLLHSIHLDTKISPKERKRLLRLFYQSHPEIFNKYFGESVVNVL
ncbi:DEP domain-containing protein 7-like [Dunckerocampus dactyliophorus]|uniref:DEP domain-containing protein 7-like n=1 Tax=Dunckerocampus dactyliophorus TaxID=161453 RepID=UPI0024054455|nr:DEP domain-containing protein 7-like [Dunckerocampus dactyliophorus]